MTEPPAEAPQPGGPSALESFIRDNRARYTEDVLRRQALAAGHAPEAVEAALLATRSAQVPVDRGAIGKRTFFMYLAVYVILDILMFVNPANHGSGFLGDRAGIGIVFLSVSLGVTLVASLIWINSPRLFWTLVGIGFILAGLSVLPGVASGGDAGILVGAAILGGIGGAIVYAAMRLGRSAVPGSPSTQLLYLMPMLLLLAVGGACVASGLPIPQPV